MITANPLQVVFYVASLFRHSVATSLVRQGVSFTYPPSPCISATFARRTPIGISRRRRRSLSREDVPDLRWDDAVTTFDACS
jgi:hypothetical protein